MTALKGFLARHEPVSKPRSYGPGSVVGAWRVTAFLGSGGNAEVYRVVREDGTSGALKVLIREDEASKTRFRREVALLSQPPGASFAKFYEAGTMDGRPYLVTELLEQVDLPETEKGIAEYLLAVCRAVGVLHQAGLIHRDIKPSNIMRRANGELVLIDFGLVKDSVKTSEPEQDVSIVAQKMVAVGTPRFAAPEQMTGGRVTAATDVHAIGRLADVAFRSNPSRSWQPIIRRATTSIPDQRYQTAAELAQAIRHRHRPRAFAIAVGVCMALALIAAVIGAVRTSSRSHGTPVDATTSSRQIVKRESVAWQSLCTDITTNLVVKELVSERFTTNAFNNQAQVFPDLTFRHVRKPTEVTIVRLDGRTNEFVQAIALDASREYFIEGPGMLSANFKAKGGTVRVHLKNCSLFNRSTVPVDKANLRYVFEGGAYLNFTDQDEPSRSVIKKHIEGFDGADDAIYFRGPSVPKGRGLLPRCEETTDLSEISSFPASLFRPEREVYI